MSYEPKRTGAAPFVVDGVGFAYWKVGPCSYECRSDDGRIRIYRPYYGEGTRVTIDDKPLRNKRGHVRGFVDREAAIKAALKALPVSP